MKYLATLCVFAGYLWVEYHAIELKPDVFYSFEDHCKKYGYAADIFEVLTPDGYLLTVFRVSRYKLPSKGPVLLVHGLGTSSHCFIMN